MALGRNAKLEMLARVPLFAACSKRELAQVAALADELDVPAQRSLIKEGERGREFFALVEGSVEVTRRGRRIRALGSGDFFGEIALVADVPRSATVTTTSPCHVLVVTDRAFEQLMKSSPSIQTKVLQALAERLAPETV
jgi:CRP/FNR family cyclic AMP-dependent transcriptional regulator